MTREIIRPARLAAVGLAFAAAMLIAVALPITAFARTATVTSISASSSYSKIERSVTLKGRLTTSSGRALKGRTLRLEKRPASGSAWSLVGKSTTSSTGRVARNVRPQADTYYRYRYAGSSRLRPSKSSSRKIIGHRYALKFWEPFNGSQVNTTTWTPKMVWGTHTNDQLQVYSPSALTVGNGQLTITATRRTPTADDDSTYTSGVVSSHGNGQYYFKYGYIETRVRVPRGTGLWAAVWLLPKDPTIGGEIDVVETRGQEPNANHMTLHYADEQVKRIYIGPDFSADYHTFAVNWNAARVIWYVDGHEQYRVTDRAKIPDDPMYPIANLQLGSWGGTPTSSTTFPKHFNVDYIKVYRYE